MQKKIIILLTFATSLIGNVLMGNESQSATKQRKEIKRIEREIRKTQKQQEKLERKRKKAKNSTPKAIDDDRTLNFDVENKSGKTLYVACFAYMKKHTFARWRWIKSPVYTVNDNQITTIQLPTIDDEEDKANTFGYLAVFKDQESAEDAIYELLPDANKLELDLLIHLKGKKVVLEIEKYGFKDEFFDYDFVREDREASKTTPSLDFIVENKTGKTVIVTCFVFEKKAKGTWLAEKNRVDWKASEDARDDMTVWRFDKTPIVTIKNGESGKILVDTIIEGRDRSEVRGYLAIYDEDEKDLAQKITYELLPTKNKLQLNKLEMLKNKKIVLEIEEYGIVDDILDYKIKPIKRIDFTKIGQSKT